MTSKRLHHRNRRLQRRYRRLGKRKRKPPPDPPPIPEEALQPEQPPPPSHPFGFTSRWNYIKHMSTILSKLFAINGKLGSYHFQRQIYCRQQRHLYYKKIGTRHHHLLRHLQPPPPPPPPTPKELYYAAHFDAQLTPDVFPIDQETSTLLPDPTVWLPPSRHSTNDTPTHTHLRTIIHPLALAFNLIATGLLVRYCRRHHNICTNSHLCIFILLSWVLISFNQSVLSTDTSLTTKSTDISTSRLTAAELLPVVDTFNLPTPTSIRACRDTTHIGTPANFL